jgi:undecaprenyl-diphosphatase
MAVLVGLVAVIMVGPAARAALAGDGGGTPATPTAEAMTAVDAVVLGLVEGITEFLPISSTGHLTVTQHLLGIGGGSPAEKEAADAYAVVIQAGAILAVVVLYWRRLVSLLQGLLGRDETGRRVLIGLVIAVVPIAVIGTIFESKIKEHLFGVGPVVFAWAVGGVVVLVLSQRGWWGNPDTDAEVGARAAPGGVDAAATTPEEALAPASTGGFAAVVRRGVALDAITARQAAVIGAAQVLALWPGTSRSLVTIIAALAVGLSLAAAVEFSFLLGLVVLSAATLVDAAKHGDVIVETFGWLNPVIGFVVAFAAAVLAVRWMVSYLQRHSLAIFGWYRLAAALVVVLLWRNGTV